MSVHAGINVPGTANAGAQDSGASSALPPVSLQADVATAMAFLLVGATLYLLFRRVDRRASGAPVVFAAVGSGLILVNLLFHHAALLVEPDPSYRSLGAQPYGGLMSLLLDMHDRGSQRRARHLRDGRCRQLAGARDAGVDQRPAGARRGVLARHKHAVGRTRHENHRVG